MLATENDVRRFMEVVPVVDEKRVLDFLSKWNSVDEAVSQYYENPDSLLVTVSEKQTTADDEFAKRNPDQAPSTPLIFSPPPYPPPSGVTRIPHRPHSNIVIEAANIRARDEQQMQNLLQTVQYQYGIYNSDIEPEHDTDYYCGCAIHQYKSMKMRRAGVQDKWSQAVMYPGEKAYSSVYQNSLFSSNPYSLRVVSPYSRMPSFGMMQPLSARNHEQSILQTIALNNKYNKEAQTAIDGKEPTCNIWEDVGPSGSDSKLVPKSEKVDAKTVVESNSSSLKAGESSSNTMPKRSKFASLKGILNTKSPEDKAMAKMGKMKAQNDSLRDSIINEEQGRWPDPEWRQIVLTYQVKVGMAQKIADLRNRQPIQYLHLLRAGYFEPIPVAWANLNSNPLKFAIEASEGWRGITPAWRGYEDTAEERLYWVLNHREGATGLRMKPDIVSEMNMARDRMASAVEPPPVYFDKDDTCHVQHTSDGYSKQVMPPPFRPFDAPEVPTDDTMILLDVSGSMDFDPVRPNYERFLITGYSKSTQPKNKDVAKAIIRRFTDAMANHDHNFQGYQLTTFSSQANHVGVVNHQNFDTMWTRVKLGGGTRVMTGWQKVKELHFEKHAESATHHPVYGWQAGPDTPMLRLLLLLDGEATDMDEFELDLLGLSWVHVTIFLIGVDGCPHHHRHANELQRISQVNHHVSFVDAQGNTPERFVTHELLKRHLGYDIPMSEFVAMEQPPPYVH